MYLNMCIALSINFIAVCEDVCKEPNIFEDGKNYMEDVQMFDDAKAFLTPENIALLEDRLKLWLRRIHEVLEISQSNLAMFNII